MSLLIEWITHIIVFLLIAAIVDLLIPASTMKRYIKLVLGLILILIFLKPVFQLFHIDIQRALESAYNEFSEASTTDEEMENLIKMQKSDIQASQDAYIVKQLSVDLAEIAENPLKEELNMEIQGIQFTFEEGYQTYEGLEEIIVTLSEVGHEKGVVSAVEEIVINTKEPQHNDQKSYEQLEEAQTLLEDIWEIEDKKVTVLWEGKKP